MNIFDNEKINSGRQPEIDIAKGLSIVFMVWCHCFIMLTPEKWDLGVFIVDGVLGGPFAAPVFMMSVGIGICYSKRSTPKDGFRRGLILLGLGILLNVFRSVFPDLVRYIITGDSYYFYESLYYSVFSVDILQFAGLTFIFIALVKKLNLNNYILFAIAICFSLLGTYLRRTSTGSDIGDGFSGYLWGSNPESYFPFLNWFIFPAAGILFGFYLIRCNDKKKFYLLLSPACLILLIAYFIFVLPDKQWHSISPYYYFLDTVDAITFALLAVLCFALYYAMTQFFPKIKFKTLRRYSEHITAIYCIHWTILGFLTLIIGFILDIQDLRFWQVTVIAASLLIVSDLIGIFYYNKIKPTIHSRR